MMKALMALPVRKLQFSFVPPQDWEQDILQIGFRLRGMIGLSLKYGCCFFNARNTPCNDCVKRVYCHYGQSFETVQSVAIEGVGKAGCMPHMWGLQLQQMGMRVQVSLNIVGMELAYQSSWHTAINALKLDVSWLDSQWEDHPFHERWQGLTPVRLRFNGKKPNNESEISRAMVSSIIAKSKMLSALHGLALPDEHLPEPVCVSAQWCEVSRFSLRTKSKQSMSGWLIDLDWSKDTPEAWKPWLNIYLSLGVGRQTSFGLGCFSTVT